MQRLTKTIAFTSEEWDTMDLQKGDLVWISEEQLYIEKAFSENLPYSVPATIDLVEKVYRNPDNSVNGVCVYSIIDGERGSYGVYKGDIVRNLTRDYRRYFAARIIQRRFKKYIQRKHQILKALKILQPIAREWYVNPNNPNHLKRMRVIAEKWGMLP